MVAVRALLLLAAASASASNASPCDLSIPRRPRQQQTLRLLRHEWVSHQLVTEVAAILLGEVLMYDVVRVAPEAGPVEDFRSIALGEADANFEVWQGGKEEQIRSWVRNGSATVASSHHVAAVSGIYTMKHTVDRYPETEFYQYLQNPRLQWLFARKSISGGEAESDPLGLCSSSAWNCSNFTWRPPACRQNPQRCLGQVFHDHVHYNQGILEQQIANNGLPLAVTYLTTNSKDREIWEAFASKSDILFQHYYPSPGVDGVPAANFVPIQFAPRKYGCNATETELPSGGFSCRLAGEALVSLVSPALSASPDAAHFAKRFSLDEADYGQLFQAWRDAEFDPKVAACKWLKQAGTGRWGSWIKFSKQVPLFEEVPPTNGCFPTCYAFFALTVGTAIVFRQPAHCVRLPSWCGLGWASAKGHFSGAEDVELGAKGRVSYAEADFPSRLVACRHIEFVKVKMALMRGMGFMSFRRDEANFCLGACEATVPPPASSCYRQYCHTPTQVLVYIMTSGLVRISLSAVTFACATGMVGALLAEVRSTIERNKQVDPSLQGEDWYTLFLSNMQTVAGIMDDFKFLPTFFITYMIGQDVARWLKWLTIMFSVQGRLHDVALVVASSYRQLNDPMVGQQQRRLLYRWYRYLNAIHYLAYFKLDPRVGTSPEQAIKDLQTVGLLQDDEGCQLHGARAKLRDTLVSWLGVLWHDELERGALQAADAEVFMRKLCDLRSILASLADMPDMQTSQLLRVMMVVVTNVLLALALIGYPTKMYAETKQCFQFWPLVASGLYFICYRGMLRVMFVLDKGPFYAQGDCVNVDALLVSTERFIFHVFRTSFKTLKSEMQCPEVPGSPKKL